MSVCMKKQERRKEQRNENRQEEREGREGKLDKGVKQWQAWKNWWGLWEWKTVGMGLDCECKFSTLCTSTKQSKRKLNQ